ncbi:MAG: hypothetical protein ACLQVI_35600 [Polyangiaceae bacterium]
MPQSRQNKFRELLAKRNQDLPHKAKRATMNLLVNEWIEEKHRAMREEQTKTIPLIGSLPRKDPDEALKNAREAVKYMRTRSDALRTSAPDDLVEAFEALDQWMSRGGFPPQDWMVNKTKLEKVERCEIAPSPSAWSTRLGGIGTSDCSRCGGDGKDPEMLGVTCDCCGGTGIER